MDKPKSASRAKKIFGVGALLFVVLGCLIMLLCNFRVQYATQAILHQQRDIEQLWLNKAMDSINAWRNELLEQAHFVSSSEMFRLFITDALELEQEERARLHLPDTLHTSHEGLRSMAEQMTYLQDLLKDFTTRRAWTEARVLLPNGDLLVGPEFPLPLLDSQRRICEQAAQSGKAVFGPLRLQDGRLAIDMADPLFEVLGSSEPKPIGVLLLSVPMERPLITFLSSQTDQREGLYPRIVCNNEKDASLAMLESGIVTLEPIKKLPQPDLPFMLRPACAGGGEVYSMGAKPAGLDWQYVLETPAHLVQDAIHGQMVQIYALGGLASVGLALLGALIWASLTSRQHKARVEELTRLNRKIDQQKTMLESINASLDAGLVLVDDHDNVLICNRNFLKIIGMAEPIEPHTPLAEVLPPDLALPIQEKIRNVEADSRGASGEIEIPDGEQKRLYRVSYYPYMEGSGQEERCAGCVAIFQDITAFRRKAIIQKEREEAMLSALGRAIESVDPSLVGQSDKMANVSALVADQLGMSEDQRQTLRIASRLSQVGKIFIDRDLLTRQGKLTPEELAEVKKAPEYADKILHNLHFDLPIRQTVREMGKKLSPDGCIAGTGEKMSQCGRSLGAINAFIAMTSPRAWRNDKGMDIRQALEILEKDPGMCRDTINALGRIDPDALLAIIKGAKDSKTSPQ